MKHLLTWMVVLGLGVYVTGCENQKTEPVAPATDIGEPAPVPDADPGAGSTEEAVPTEPAPAEPAPETEAPPAEPAPATEPAPKADPEETEVEETKTEAKEEAKDTAE